MVNNPIDEPCSSAEPPKKCPVCHLINPGTAQICDCGYSFETHLRGKPLAGSMSWTPPTQIGEFLSPKARLARIIRRILGVGIVAIGLVATYNFWATNRIGWTLPGIPALDLFGPLLLTIGAFLVFYRRPVARVRGPNILLWIGGGLIAVPVGLLVLLLFMATSRSSGAEILTCI